VIAAVQLVAAAIRGAQIVVVAVGRGSWDANGSRQPDGEAGLRPVAELAVVARRNGIAADGDVGKSADRNALALLIRARVAVVAEWLMLASPVIANLTAVVDRAWIFVVAVPGHHEQAVAGVAREAQTRRRVAEEIRRAQLPVGVGTSVDAPGRAGADSQGEEQQDAGPREDHGRP